MDLNPGRRVADLHRAVDVICDAWPKASEDANSGGLRGHNFEPTVHVVGSHADPTGDAAVNTGHAAAWLCELHDVAVVFVERMPGGSERLRNAWHALFNQCPSGWAYNATQRLYRLADDALTWWPPPPTVGDRVDDLEVGDGRRLANDVGLCALCGGVTIAGRRRFVPNTSGQLGGDWFCTSPCWYAVTMDRGTHPRQAAC